MNYLAIAFLIFSPFLASLNIYAMKLAECEKKFLAGIKISELIKEEAAKEIIASEYLERLKKIRNCEDLLDMAILKENGMVKERNPVSAKVLETFVNFHASWLMPKDPEYNETCQDKYQWDVYDKLAPSYHLTRALFQKDRKAEMAVIGYGDLRSVRAGENPKSSDKTGISSEQYVEFLGTKDKFQFTSKKAIIGFLYKRKLSSTNFRTPSSPKALVKLENWPEENLNIYKHFGGGLLGSPSFLYHYGQRKAHYRSNGKQILPRKYANAIWNNLLCKEPNQEVHELPSSQMSTWNHPITKESNCISCHAPLDQMASGFRHITFLPTKKSCSNSSPQIYIPFAFKASGTRLTWSEQEPSDPPFHLSYPVSYHKGKRVVGLAQLGKALAQDINFYKCQVSKYYEFIYEKKATDQYIEEHANKYKEHQNGLKLIKSILAKGSIK